ncbi:hypothetical protein DCAR_0312274 [Daucus carota subsp. sativus]|uniref:Phytosulfokine n=1 Tax=Daucus carota subsp. sativus TaxID=79200 RepID=A0AAF0WRW6_DAUCS|nr:hypothetical protein DCAR_0312274 [Daucus carota subsp. sativus]
MLLSCISHTCKLILQHYIDEVERENCEDIGNEECLMRRTLVAHIDYIYTQKQKP